MQPIASKSMKILEVRDPVLEGLIGTTDYVPSDYCCNTPSNEIEKDKGLQNGGYVITGANMGGTLCLLFV